MAAPLITIKVKAGEKLMERIKKASKELEVVPANFIEYAIENELQRHETQALREDITFEEIRKNMGEGQSLEIHMDDEDISACELCLTPIETPRKVHGPLLCNDCMELAKGPNLDAVMPQP